MFMVPRITRKCMRIHSQHHEPKKSNSIRTTLSKGLNMRAISNANMQFVLVFHDNLWYSSGQVMSCLKMCVGMYIQIYAY